MCRVAPVSSLIFLIATCGMFACGGSQSQVKSEEASAATAPANDYRKS